MDENLREEIYKCSKCGLCKSVCPIYLTTKNEMFSPRGRLIILKNFYENNKKPSKIFIKNLDICLECNLCKEFCPSNINSSEIFKNFKQTSKIFYFKLYLKFFINGIINSFMKNNPKRNISNKKVIYFEGCYNKFIDASDRNASIKLLEKLGYEIEKIISDCCGYVYKSNNDEKKYLKNKENVMNNCNTEAKYIICSCDTCYKTLMNYKDKAFTSKLITLDKFLKINNYEIKNTEKLEYFRPLLRTEELLCIEGIKEINKKSDCSLMENFFAIKHSKLSKKISKENNKYDNYKEIITSCNITKWGLKEIYKKNVISLSERLKK